VVEGWGAERTFPTTGALDASFDGDRLRVRVEPSPEDRFLVLNERYYPGWQATVDGRPAEIFPTNLVMRGVLVPPGATTIEMHYVPFIVSWPGLALILAGLVLTGLIWWGLRYVVLRMTPIPLNRLGSETVHLARPAKVRSIAKARDFLCHPDEGDSMAGCQGVCRRSAANRPAWGRSWCHA
jgi:hypothetical protein